MAAPRQGRVHTDAAEARRSCPGPAYQLYLHRVGDTTYFVWDRNKINAAGRLAEAAGCRAEVAKLPDRRQVAVAIQSMSEEEKQELLASLRAEINGRKRGSK